MQELFSQIDQGADRWETNVSVSFLEIYNELIRDLLSDDYPSCPRGGLSLREDEKNHISVVGLATKIPKSAEEVLEYVLLGNSRRTCSPTHANAESSRSHAVLQVNISRRPKGGDEVDVEAGKVTTSYSSATLSIIDLAGSERASATLNMGNRMKEGANINKSLLALGNCINALCLPPSRAGVQHIPYRDSKLTRLLKFSLGGNCRTVMIVCVSPCSVHLEDTGNTLKYANRAKNIVTKVSRNINGVERNITQYLRAIEEKNATIALLQAQLNEQNSDKSAAQQRKADEARREADRLMSEMQRKTATCLPVMIVGATSRANWDAAELRIEVLKKRVGEIDGMGSAAGSAELAEKSVLQRLIQREDQLYGSNPEEAAKRNQGSTQSAGLNMVLRSMQEMKIGKLQESDVINIKLEATLQQAESSKAQLEEREKAYRASIKAQAVAMATLVGAFIRHSTTMGDKAKQVDHVPEVAELLRSLKREAEKVTDNLLGIKTLPMMSPARETSPAYKDRLFAPPSLTVPPPVPPPTLSVPVRPSKRMSLAPIPGSAVRPSPAIRRLIGAPAARVGSPIRAMFSSPRKRSKPPSSFMKPKAKDVPTIEKKRVVWRDEAGEGAINDFRQDSGTQAVTSSEEESPPTTPTPANETEETAWIDDSEEQVAADTSIMSYISRPTIAKGPAALAQGRKDKPNYRSQLQSLMAVSEDSSFESSPGPPSKASFERARAERLAAHGGPIRPGRPSLAPLLRSHEPLRNSSAANLGTAAPSRRLSVVAAPVTKPKPFSFASSNDSASRQAPAPPTSARAAGPGLNYPGSSLGPPSRRMSSSGPMRTEKKRSRTSLLPVFENGQSPGGAGHSKMLFGALLSPSKKSSPRKPSRRPSVAPAVPSLLGGPPMRANGPFSSTTSSSPTVPTALLRVAMPTLSSQSKAVPASLRRLPSTASMAGVDSDRDSGRGSSYLSNGGAMKPLVPMKM